jgi:hypothetical protein
MKFLNQYKIFSVAVFMLLLPALVRAQLVDYRIHQRGMLHETVYNDGVIGRPWQYGSSGEKQSLPSFEWPPYSKTIINGIEYSGQHNIIGGGIYISANEVGKPGWENRIFSFCGGIGTGSGPELPAGRWSFPISIERIENYPLLPDGELNPNYNPDEAEEIIIAKWATNVGITVTRTSRAWSYPDYNDMIIYEYELEYTGDTDGNPATIERTAPLVDVLFHVNYGFSPSMLGYQRNYGEWKYEQGMYRQDNRSSFDPDYWLTFMQTVHTGAADAKDEYMAFKPEPDEELFKYFAETGVNGGGLLSPQAPGYCWLYWDTDHFAVVDPVNPERNESEYANYMLKDSKGRYFETDENGYILQPWNMKTESGNTRIEKMEDRATTMDERWWTVYGELGAPEGFPSDEGRFVLPKGRQWLGRARYEWDESYNGVQIINGFGPYKMKLGDKLEFAYAEVVGYGGTEGKIICGGQTSTQFFPIRSMDRKVVVNGKVYTEHYLQDYGYPDYIDSDIISVNQVAHKAWEAYLGQQIPYDPERKGPAGGMLFPEDNPKPSQNSAKYKIPIPVPAPVIKVENTPQATVKITWKRSVENFSAPRMTGKLSKFYVWRSNAGMGPWELLGEVQLGNVNEEGLYEFIDNDETYKLGETKYYSVTSVDDKGNQSGRTNITPHVKNVRSVDKMEKVYAVPNPFIVKSGFEGHGQDNAIGFYGLPEKCTIRIYSYAGQLVETIEHDSPVYSTAWFQVTRNNQDIASGIYFYVVTTPSGETATGKLVIVK